MNYFNLVYSHPQYAIVAWGSAIKTSPHRLNTIHNRSVETNSRSSNRCHVTPFCGQLNSLKLGDVYHLENAKLMHNSAAIECSARLNVSLLLLVLCTPIKPEILPLVNTTINQSTPNVESDQSGSKAQEPGSK